MRALVQWVGKRWGNVASVHLNTVQSATAAGSEAPCTATWLKRNTAGILVTHKIQPPGRYSASIAPEKAGASAIPGGPDIYATAIASSHKWP